MLDEKLKPLFLLVFILLSACSGESSAPGDTGSDTATILANLPASADATASTYQTLQGRALDLDRFQGSKVFVNYWATWCAPCIEEIPSINRAAAILENENFVCLFASDEPIETISEFLDERQFAGNFIKLNPYFGSYGIDAVPSSILIDENGEIINSWSGASEWDSPEMLAELRESR